MLRGLVLLRQFADPVIYLLLAPVVVSLVAWVLYARRGVRAQRRAGDGCGSERGDDLPRASERPGRGTPGSAVH
jgi:hypothetical protein